MLLSASMAAAAFLLDIFRGIRVQSMLLALSILSACGCTLQFLLGHIREHLIYQAAFLLTGTFVFLFVSGTCNVRKPLFLLAASSVLALLVINYLFGAPPKGSYTTARLWIFIGGISVQPGEIVKILLIFLGDMGNAAVIFLILVVQVFYLLDSWKLALCLVAAAFSAFMWLIQHSAYARLRLSNWGHAMERPGGVHQQADLLEEILFGGLLKGTGPSAVKRLGTVFAVESDLAIGALLAIFGAGILIIILGAYVILICQASTNHSIYPFSHLVLVQASMMIFAQVFLNFGGSIDLIPLTGITAPLISLGGSSMVCFGALSGMCLAALCPVLRSVDSERQETENVDILSNLARWIAGGIKEVLCTVRKKDTEN